MGNTAGEGMCACLLFTSAWTGYEITWNHENQENQKNQENQEDSENHENHENRENQGNHENHKNQKYTINATKSFIMWSPIV